MGLLIILLYDPLHRLFFWLLVTEEWDANFFSRLNDKKSSLDIPIKLFRLPSKTLSKPFAFTFNKSISTGIVPDVFKVSKVTPVFKSGALSDPGNYRPKATLYPPSVRPWSES